MGDRFIDSDAEEIASNPGSPNSRNMGEIDASPEPPSSPPFSLETATPSEKKMVKIVSFVVAEETKKQAKVVKRKLELMDEKQDSTKHSVLEVKHGLGDVRKTVQSIEANQKKSQKLKPKEALNEFQQKMSKRLTWKHIMKATPKNEMMNDVYQTMRTDFDVPPSAEDHLKKFVQQDSSNTKSHLRGLITADLKNMDYQQLNSTTKWLKTHLSEDELTVSDKEFLMIMALAFIKFENNKHVPMESRADQHNKELVTDSVDNWWQYCGSKMTRYGDREESCKGTVELLMGRYGYEPTAKKNRLL